MLLTFCTGCSLVKWEAWSLPEKLEGPTYFEGHEEGVSPLSDSVLSGNKREMRRGTHSLLGFLLASGASPVCLQPQGTFGILHLPWLCNSLVFLLGTPFSLSLLESIANSCATITSQTS